jgi:hypothetical protein
MDNVRQDKDIEIFQEGDTVFVAKNLQYGESLGGISTFATPGRGKNWWKLDPETEIPALLKLVNDR